MTNVGQRVADALTRCVGSWPFILAQSAILLAWIIFNTSTRFRHWDEPPYILLNLMLSFQAAYTGPVVLMSSRRQAERDSEIIAKIDAHVAQLIEHDGQSEARWARVLAKLETGGTDVGL